MCWISDVFISTIIVQTCWLFESPIEVVAFSAGYTHATDQIKAKDACFLLVKPRPQTLIFRPSFCVIAAQIKGTNFDSPIEAAGSPFREVFDSLIEAVSSFFRPSLRSNQGHKRSFSRPTFCLQSVKIKLYLNQKLTFVRFGGKIQTEIVNKTSQLR